MTAPPTDLSAAFAHALSGDFARLRGGNWTPSELLAVVEDHGIGPLLWELRPGDVAGTPDADSVLEARVRGAATRDIFVQREMRTVLDALAASGVTALVIKGSALAYTVYPKPWLRPRTDTDLLIPHEHVAAATRALEGCGYTRCDAISTGEFVSHQVAFERTDSHGAYHVIDLHWKIANPHVVADALPFELLWRDAQAAPALGNGARVPSVVGSMLLACIHRLAHHQGHDRLIWLYDLKLLSMALPAEGWADLRRLAIERGVAGLCLDGLQQAKMRLGASLPAEVEAALIAAAPHEPSQMYLAGPVRKRDVLVSDLTALNTWRARAQLVREHLVPAPAFMRKRYGTTARWLLPALYLHRVVTGAYRWVRH